MRKRLEELLGRQSEELEEAMGLTHYFEVADGPLPWTFQDHCRIIEALLSFVGSEPVQIVKTDDGMLQEIVDISTVNLREQLLLLEKDQGMFYDEELTISYVVVGEQFFTYVNAHMLMFSGTQSAVQRMVRELKAQGIAIRGPERIVRTGCPKVLQLKITLAGVEPKVWRRLLVEDTLTFHGLHMVLQKVMGWRNQHEYTFTIGSRRIVGTWDLRYSPKALMDSFPSKVRALAAVVVTVNEFLSQEGQRVSYVYNMEDQWRHTVEVEAVLPREERGYPIVLDGTGMCPPEFCGGPQGYRESLVGRRDVPSSLEGEPPSQSFDCEAVNRVFHDPREDTSPYVVEKVRKLGRNDSCYCGSGKKYKKCCLEHDRRVIGQGRKVPIETV